MRNIFMNYYSEEWKQRRAAAVKEI